MDEEGLAQWARKTRELAGWVTLAGTRSVEQKQIDENARRSPNSSTRPASMNVPLMDPPPSSISVRTPRRVNFLHRDREIDLSVTRDQVGDVAVPEVGEVFAGRLLGRNRYDVIAVCFPGSPPQAAAR